MISAARSRAEQRFEQIQKRQQKALSEQEQIAEDRRRNSERLKKLRLANEAEKLNQNTERLQRLRRARVR